MYRNIKWPAELLGLNAGWAVTSKLALFSQWCWQTEMTRYKYMLGCISINHLMHHPSSSVNNPNQTHPKSAAWPTGACCVSLKHWPLKCSGGSSSSDFYVHLSEAFLLQFLKTLTSAAGPEELSCLNTGRIKAARRNEQRGLTWSRLWRTLRCMRHTQSQTGERNNKLAHGCNPLSPEENINKHCVAKQHRILRACVCSAACKNCAALLVFNVCVCGLQLPQHPWLLLIYCLPSLFTFMSFVSLSLLYCITLLEHYFL